ncbi:helix-turn-helix domain-containing protein [Paenibacillus gansuensis]|uniref:Helix-turn-helix domain-containing protein n=1 Tax=Paenibacillus gansuensis TaxID=306542 RepID=A0ABW5P928_9BACL
MECLQFEIPPTPQFMTVGHGTWAPGQRHFERNFQVYDMLFVITGALYMGEEGREYSILPGQLLILEAGKTHVGTRPCEEHTEIYWVHFIHAEPAEHVDSQHIAWDSVIPRDTDESTTPTRQFMYLPKYAYIDIRPLLPILNGMVSLHADFTLQRSMELHARVMQLFMELQIQVAASQQPTQSRKISEQAQAFLRDTHLQPFSSEALERELKYNVDYITRCMKKHTGMSPVKYLHYLRIEDAKQRLIHTDAPLPLLAEQTGFPDYNYFIRLFRQHTGTTPGQYRRIRRGQV